VSEMERLLVLKFIGMAKTRYKPGRFKFGRDLRRTACTCWAPGSGPVWLSFHVCTQLTTQFLN